MRNFIRTDLVIALMLSAIHFNLVFAAIEENEYRYIFSNIPNDKHKFIVVDFDKNEIFFQLNKCEVEKTKVAKNIILGDADLDKAKCKFVKKYRVAMIGEVLPMWYYEDFGGEVSVTAATMFALAMGGAASYGWFAEDIVKVMGQKLALAGHYATIFSTFLGGAFVGGYVADYLEENYFEPQLFNHKYFELLNLHPGWVNADDYDHRYITNRSIDGYLEMVYKIHINYINDEI